MFTALIATIKFLAIAVTGIFGILGLLTKYRDQEDRLTRWGQVALWGIVASTVIALASQELDFLKQARDEHETNVKSLSRPKQIRTYSGRLDGLLIRLTI